MCVIGTIGIGLSRPEAAVALLGIIVLVVGGLWLLSRWLFSGPRTPDPWDREVTAELEREDCPQICFHCQAPQDPASHFCTQCGTMVGPQTSLIPPLYLYSIGAVLRAGTEGTYPRSPLLTFGYFVAAFSYLLFVLFPLGLLLVFFYWYKLLKNLPGERTATPAVP